MKKEFSLILAMGLFQACSVGVVEEIPKEDDLLTCGDSECDATAGEDCHSCPADCGACDGNGFATLEGGLEPGSIFFRSGYEAGVELVIKNDKSKHRGPGSHRRMVHGQDPPEIR